METKTQISQQIYKYMYIYISQLGDYDGTTMKTMGKVNTYKYILHNIEFMSLQGVL